MREWTRADSASARAQTRQPDSPYSRIPHGVYHSRSSLQTPSPPGHVVGINIQCRTVLTVIPCPFLSILECRNSMHCPAPMDACSLIAGTLSSKVQIRRIYSPVSTLRGKVKVRIFKNCTLPPPCREHFVGLGSIQPPPPQTRRHLHASTHLCLQPHSATLNNGHMTPGPERRERPSPWTRPATV